MSTAPKRHTWISLWFLFCYLVVLWDMVIHSHSAPLSSWWALPVDVEHIWRARRFRQGHIKSMNLSAKGVLSIPEILLAMIYLIQVHVVPSPVAPLFGFTAALATMLKGVLWVFEEFYCGWCTIGHNAPLQIFISWTLPTMHVCLWALLPAISAWKLGSDMAESLKFLAEMSASESNGPKAEKKA